MKLGWKLGGDARLAGRWASILDEFGSVLPAYPGEAVLQPARRPSPPLLDGKAPVLQQAIYAAKAYRNTLFAYTGRSPYFSGEKQVQSQDQFECVLDAVPTLIRLQVPPHSWTFFSLEIFRRYVHPKLLPPPRFAFSLKRLEERQEWFSWYESFNQAQSVVWIAEEHHHLLKRYESMKRELLISSKLSSSGVEEVVQKYLPRHLYRDLLRKSKLQYEQRESMYERQLREAAWIW